MPGSTQAKIQLDIALETPVSFMEKYQTVYLRIGLSFKQNTRKKPLVPVYMVLVIDTSRSMQGKKMAQAKETAMMAVTRLRPTDLIAIVACDHQGKVLLPATKAREQKMIAEVIEMLDGDRQIALFDSTALFDGIEKGAEELLKYRRPYQINRMILLSDGLANVGPSSSTEIGELGSSLNERNIVVTTIGFGADCHESLLNQLSQPSEGFHTLVEDTSDMIRIIEQEFLDLASVVAQEIEVTLVCRENVFPLKVLGREAKIKGHTVSVQLNQLYNKVTKSVLVELEISSIPEQQALTLAEVTVIYRNLKTRRRQHLKEFLVVDCVSEQKEPF